MGGHTLDQVAREAVDAAKTSGTGRLALIMVGADIGPPMDLTEWRAAVAQQLAQHGLAEVQVELTYSSWAAIGRVLRLCAEREPAWSRYIDDALAQLRFNALFDYDGAPMFDDIETLTVPRAIEAYNRTIHTIRQFFLAVHGQPRFAALGLVGFGERGRFALQKDGGSKSPEQPEDWFTLTNVLSAYRRENWAQEALPLCRGGPDKRMGLRHTAVEDERRRPRRGLGGRYARRRRRRSRYEPSGCGGFRVRVLGAVRSRAPGRSAGCIWRGSG
jgi:hypothetical protein